MSLTVTMRFGFVSLSLFVFNCRADTLVDFESPPGGLVGITYWEGTPVTPQARITNQYGSMGILMANVALIDLGVGHATSGSDGIGGIDSDGNVDWGAPVYFTFVDPLDNTSPAVTNSFSVSLDNAGGSGNTITISGFDINGNLLGSVSHPDNGGSVTLQGIGAIHTVVAFATLIYHPAGGIGLDDVRFGPLSPLGRQASDTAKPISHLSSLPSSETELSFQVQWSGTDTGSGIRDFTIYVSDNGGPFTAWQTQTIAVQATFHGMSGHSYGFYGAARDWAGNQENPKSTPETSTVIAGSTSKPVSHVVSLPATESTPTFTVQWSGTDNDSGIRDFTVYVSDNNAPFYVWLVQTTGTQAPFTGVGGHIYGFYTIARDWAGNQEDSKTVAEATTQVLSEATKPVSHVSALAATAMSPNFQVQWSGSDAGSGLRDYTIYVSDNNNLFAPWLNQTSVTQAWFAGLVGHGYRFFSTARDWAGNVEDLKSAAEATTRVPALMATDVNGDGRIDCVDLALVKASFGKKTGQTGFDSRADVNHDGLVDVRDLASVSQKLIPGTRCQ